MAMGTFTFLSSGLWQLNGENHCKIEEVSRDAKCVDYEVMTLPFSSKTSLFSMKLSPLSSIRSRAESILHGIRDDRIAAQFDLKATAISNTPFRLLKCIGAHSPRGAIPSDDSFIALSYCWHNNDWSHQTSDTSTSSNVPISTTLFEVLLAERISLDEGIWIDQLCINQSDDMEKTQAVGSMDVIYQNARLVVVALEDILVDEDEEVALHGWMEKNERRELWDPGAEIGLGYQLTKLMWKIYSARWFTRAWCSHELRVSSRHLFLISLADGGRPGPKVLKITSAFLHDMSLIVARGESIRPSNNFIHLKTLYSNRCAHFNRYMLSKLRRLPAWTVEDPEDSTRMPSYMRVFAEVFGYGSSVVADKLAIVLNVLGCGLYFKGPPMTEQQCCYTFYHLALGAGDPTTLATCGEQLSAAAVWMRWPRAADIQEPAMRGTRHLRLEKAPLFSDQEMSLDLVFLTSSSTLHRATTTHRSKAERIIQACTEIFPDEGAWLLDDVDRNSPDSIVKRNLYVEILACALECGVEWIIKSARLKDPSGFDAAFEEALNYICNDQCIDQADHLTTESQQYFHAVLDLLDGLAGLWLMEESTASWLPAWIQTGTELSDRSMILCPTDSTFQIAIPALLLGPDYSFLKRIWLVTGKGFDNESNGRWAVLSKTSSFGTADFTGLLHSKMLRREQRICG